MAFSHHTYNINIPATATRISAAMLPPPGAPDVSKVEGLALGPDGLDCAATLDSMAAAFDDVAPVAAVGLVLLLVAYGVLLMGITGSVTTVTGADADAALLGARVAVGDDAAAETGHMVV